MVLSLFSLSGQVAIVTGAGKGIGKACALALAQAGADVALTARTQADLDSVAADIRALGRRAITVAGDISDEAVMDTLVARTVAELGALHNLINNVGGSGPNHPLKMGGADFSAALLQLRHGRLGGGPRRVGDGDQPDEALVGRDVDHGAATALQALGVCLQGAECHRCAVHELAVAE